MQSQILKGDFVTLRPLLPTDAEITLRWRQAQRAKFLSAGASSVATQSEWIASRPASEYNFIIELNSGFPVGMLSLVGIDPVNRHGEPGRFLIGEEEAVHGLPAAVEAMKLVYELAFDRIGLVRISGIVAENNQLMIKWQKYLGMKEEGRLRKHLCQNGRYYDAIYLGLLVDEYRAITVPRMNSLIKIARL